jgi:hypothetical protein
MKLSTDYQDFKAKLDLLHPRYDGQGTLDLNLPLSAARPRRRS